MIKGSQHASFARGLYVAGTPNAAHTRIDRKNRVVAGQIIDRSGYEFRTNGIRTAFILYLGM